MDASYHDFLEAAYFGRYSVFDRARNNYGKPGIPYRNDRAGMDSLTAKPSYHFSRDLTLALANHVYVNGLPFGGERGSHASPKPHDRQGHYRTRATPAPGWEGPIVPSSGEFKGMTRYRRWFDKTTVMGGAPGHGPGRGHPKAAQPKAPQFRVVR